MNAITLRNGMLGACAAVGLLAAGCGRNASPAAVPPTPSPTPTRLVQVPIVVPAPHPVLPAPGVVPPQVADGAATWATIKDDTYDQRASFVAGASQMQSLLAAEVAQLDAKRAALPSTVDTKDWDFARRDVDVSQSYFKSMIVEAGGTTAEFWDQEKGKVGDAWQKSQDAVDKVRTATTF